MIGAHGDGPHRNLEELFERPEVVRLEPAAAHQQLAGVIADEASRRTAAAYVTGGGIDTVRGGSMPWPSALAPLAELHCVFAVSVRRHDRHQPRRRRSPRPMH